MSETQTEAKTTNEADAAAAPSPGSVPTAPCYCCGSRRGVPVSVAWWGIGLPRLFAHVRCVQCPVTYDARSGESNGWVALGFLVLYLTLAVAAGVWAWVACCQATPPPA